MRLEQLDQFKKERKFPSFLAREEKLFKNEQSLPEKEVRNAIFDSFVFQHLIKSVENDLEDAGFDEKEIQAFETSLMELSDEEMRQALSIPFETRERVFREFRRRIDNKEMDINDMTKELLNRGKKAKSTIGFHLSPKVVVKNRRPDGSISWSIEGYELDDRDNMKMAYYSLDYENLYRKKRGNNLYLVRASLGENSGHKRDQSNNWGRASNLSIIDSLNLKEAEAYVDKVIEELKSRGLVNKN